MTAAPSLEAAPAAVLLVGLPAELASWLQARFHALSARAVGSVEEASEELESRAWSLVVVDERLPVVSIEELLQRIRQGPDRSVPPVLACLSPDTPREHARRLIERSGVHRVLYHPLDREELARQVGSIVRAPLRPVDPLPLGRDQAGLDRLWERFRATTEERLEQLEEATIAALEGRLDEEGQRHAEREAHKFAGSIGTFGFMGASQLGREVEEIFAGRGPIGRADAQRLADRLVAIRAELEEPRAGGTAQEEAEAADRNGRPALLIMTRDHRLTADLAREAADRGFELAAVADPAAARARVARRAPTAVLVDLSGGPEVEARVWELLEDLSAREPPIPALALAEDARLSDRIDVARRGGRAFIEKPVAADRVLDLVADATRQASAGAHRILSVDDDPSVLAVLRSQLTHPGLQVETLEDPLRFWDALEETEPDLLVLDLEMPHLDGIEICRVVRNDPGRSDLPILFLTGRTDSETVRRIFSAGADDYVSKPIVPAELRSRIHGRLERLQLQRRLSETDSLTGVRTRQKSEQTLDRYLRMAHRHDQPLSLAVLDLDRFKRVNDRHGHSTGDRVLRRFGQLLQRAFAGESVVGRWGGEEFVIGMYGAGREDAVHRVRELQEMLDREELSAPDGSTVRLGFSAGVATAPADGEDVQELFRAADAALLEAKARGRHRVLAAGAAVEAAEQPAEVDIVLVEDDEALGPLLVHTLEARGYRTRWIRDGQEALEALGGAAPALRAPVVLLDIDLPGRDGLAVLRHLRDAGALDTSRVIMLTFRSEEEAVHTSLELGAFDHVGKPFSIPVLLQRIRRALEA